MIYINFQHVVSIEETDDALEITLVNSDVYTIERGEENSYYFYMNEHMDRTVINMALNFLKTLPND